jgi:hypothetical protein
MPEAFVPLAQHVRAEYAPVAPVPEPEPASAPVAAASHAVRRFHAALADALAAAKDDLLRDLACSVLARELALAPADVERIAIALLARVRDERPVRVRAHADDVSALAHIGVPVEVDERARRGDLTIVLRYGSIDASLGARLADVLRT